MSKEFKHYIGCAFNHGGEFDKNLVEIVVIHFHKPMRFHMGSGKEDETRESLALGKDQFEIRDHGKVLEFYTEKYHYYDLIKSELLTKDINTGKYHVYGVLTKPNN